jgi:hypothetical protein
MQVILPWLLMQEIGTYDVTRHHECKHGCVHFYGTTDAYLLTMQNIVFTFCCTPAYIMCTPVFRSAVHGQETGKEIYRNVK